MNRFSYWPIVLGLVLCFLCGVAAQEAKPKYKELPNFHSVNTKLFRGGQPQKGGLQKLSEMGIKTIIDLRDDDDRAQSEEGEARTAGLRYFNVPLDNFGRPSDEKVNKVLSLITAAENQPVFVHCKRGSDRTGTIIAIYRISFDGWTGDQAMSEAKRYGLGFWQTGMKDYIGDYYKRQKK